jgi:hypothetical protein
MTTAYELLLETAKLLTYVRQSTATAVGGATTTVDSTRNERDDAWIDGIIWKPAASECRRITDWVQSTHTFTHAALTAGVGSGNAYYVSDKEFPKDVLVMAVNAALSEIELPTFDDTSLTTVANQESYTLPAACDRLCTLEIAVGSVAPYQYAACHTWYQLGDKIYFNAGREPDLTGYKMRLGYNARPTLLDPVSATLDATTIDDRIPPERLKWMAAVHALRQKVKRTEGAKSIHAQSIAEASAQVELMKRKHPVPILQKQARLRL